MSNTTAKAKARISEYGHLYYAGLPTRPRLLAGTRPLDHYWWNGTGEPIWRGPDHAPTKELFPITSKPFIECWDRIRSRLMELLEPYSADLNIDATCIGYDSSTAVHVVWVGVPKDRISHVQAAEIVDISDRVLHEEGVNDAETEVRETRVQLLAGPQLLDPATIIPGAERFGLRFSSALGFAIKSRDVPDTAGSAGLFLRDSSGQIFILTAQHVLCRTTAERSPEQPNSDSPVSLFLSVKWRERLERELKNSCAYALQTAEIRKLQRKKDHSEVLRIDQEVKAEVRHFKELAVSLLQWQPEPARAIGRIFAHSDRVATNEDSGHEWGLISVSADKFAAISNVIDLRDLDQFAWENIAETVPLELLASGQLPVKGVLTREECENATFPVLMSGAASHVTIGSASLKSGVRQNGRWYEPISVRSKGAKAFSRKGDSGSVVVDGSGRIVGIVISGTINESGEFTVRGDSTDVTYVTPFYWIMESFRRFGLDLTVV